MLKKGGLEAIQNKDVVNFYNDKKLKQFITENDNPCFDNHTF